MNRPKAIGTAAETAVVRVLRTHGWPNAERRALSGAVDLGDITGTPGIVWEVKAGDAAKRASDALVGIWLDETTREQQHAGVDVGVLVVARAGIGPGNAHRWWAIVTSDALVPLLCASNDVGPLVDYGRDMAVRMQLCLMTALLRRAGYGSSVSEGCA